MDSLEVTPANLAGFSLDLRDLATNFSSNAGRLLPGVALPDGSAELMSGLAPAFKKFQDAVSAAHQHDATAINTLGSRLDTARHTYQGAENTSTDTILSAGNLGVPVQTAELRTRRFSGLRLPTLPQVDETPGTVRKVVTTGIDVVTPFDGPWGKVVGLKPAADYLAPLVADWEALQAVGERIGLLGINDYTSSENMTGGTTWLQTSWTRLGSQAFGGNADRLAAAIAGRSNDFDAVSKIVKHAGTCLERLVYNQTVGLSTGITRPMSFLGFTLPLGVWALLTRHPMRGSYRSEILSAVDSLKSAAKSRQADMTAMIDRISSALEYSPGRTPPKFTPADFEVPPKVTDDSGGRWYGFGSNTWWQDNAAV